MSKVIFGDVVRRANTKEDRHNTDKIYYVGGEHIESNEVLIENCGLIEGSTIGPMFYFGFKAGDVLFVSRNPHLRKAGMVTFDGICSEKTFVLETKDESVLLQRYLAFVMQSDHFWSYMEAHKSGSVNFFINWSTLEKYEFELPDIDKQKALSDMLWAVNDAKKAYRTLLIKTDNILKSQFIEMFGEPSTNPKNYPVKKLSDIAYYWNGLTYKPEDVADEGVIVLRSGNIQNGQLDFNDIVRVKSVTREKAYVAKNDILMCSRNGSAALVGKVALIDELTEPMAFGAFMMIRSELFAYLLQYFQTTAFRNQISTGTTTINQITGKMLDSVTLPVPPKDIVEQFEIRIRSNDKSKQEIQQAIDNLSCLERSILAENFN